MQQPAGNDVARLSSYLKTRYHLDLLCATHDRLPDAEASPADMITFVGLTELAGDKRIAITIKVSYEVAEALIQQMNFLDHIM
jgi:hypothetical protein